MKILVITGSPHKKGTSALLADEFIRRAREAGNQVDRFDSAFEDVHPCIGCNKCGYGVNPCIFQDAMNKLNPLLLEADVIVFATPIYYWSFPAQLKAVIDRFQVTVFSLSGKKAVLLATAASTEAWVKDALDVGFNNMLKFIKWKDAGRIYALGCPQRMDIEQTDYPKQAYMLGKGIAE